MPAAIVNIPKTVKQKREKRKLPSHALANAKERLAAFRLANAEVLKEYDSLREAVRLAAAELGRFEQQMRSLINGLEKINE